MSGRRVFALIPAAGMSRRMGQIKQLMPYRDSCMLDVVLDSVMEAPLDGLVLVANPDIADRYEEFLPDQCFIEINDDPDSEMILSVQLGFDRLEEECDMSSADGVMILLADQPQVGGGTIATCAESYRLPRNPPDILIASYRGRRGHPAIFSVEMMKIVSEWPGDRRLNELARLYPDRVRELPITTCPMPIDVNTPADYERLKNSL